MSQARRYETRWNQLACRVGEHDTTLNSALTTAMATIQRRNGSLPGGHDTEEWEDLYKLALAGYKLAS
jgi:hypothetical protein